MKKIVLLILVFGIGAFAYSQNRRVKMEPSHLRLSSQPAIGIEPVQPAPIVKSDIQKKRIVPPADRNVNIVTIIDIGTSANAYGYGYESGQKSLVWVDPNLNTVTNFHRMGGSLDPDGYSGDLGFDISTDGGASFTNMNECYVATNNNGGTYYTDAARYPNHGIYNPAGNTDPANAYVAFFAPNLDQSNASDSWGGYSYGVESIGDTSYKTKHLLSTHPPFYQYIPDGYDLTSQGKVFVTDINQDWSSGTVVYQGNLIVNTGVWDDNARDFVYTQDLLDAPVWDYFARPWMTRVAFSPDGNTGYIVEISNDGTAWSVPDYPNLYPIFWKTTDGGETWDGPTIIQIDGPNGIGGIVYHLLTDDQIAAIYLPPIPAREDIPYTYTSDIDLAVDNNGNLHIAGMVCAAGAGDGNGGIGLFVSNYLGAIIDVFTHDGGTTWEAEEMGRIQNWQGTFGDLTEENRTQITTSPSGDKIFISWLDTDIEDATENNQPNIFVRGFDPVTYMKTDAGAGVDAGTNVTQFSAGMWQAYFFAAPKTCFIKNGDYNIPFVYENMDPTDPAQPVQFEYVQDFSFSGSSFTIQSVNENKIGNSNKVASVSQNFPNPFNGQTYVNVSLKQGTNVTLNVFTLTGQNVSTKNYGYLTAGSHNLTISSNNLPTGVYFYTVKAGDNKVTRKMIVQ